MISEWVLLALFMMIIGRKERAVLILFLEFDVVLFSRQFPPFPILGNQECLQMKARKFSLESPVSQCSIQELENTSLWATSLPSWCPSWEAWTFDSVLSVLTINSLISPGNGLLCFSRYPFFCNCYDHHAKIVPRNQFSFFLPACFIVF